MTRSPDDVAEMDAWFRIGYELERLRDRLPASGEGARAAESGDAAGSRTGGRSGPLSDPALEALLVSGGSVVLMRLLRGWRGRGGPGPGRLVKSGLAGAGAALGGLLLAPLLRGRPGLPAPDEELREVLLSGVGRGLLYASVVEPRAPGPALFRGLLYGGIEYALTPWGGLEAVLGPMSPRRTIPLLSDLLEPAAGSEESGLEDHLLFGALLALLYD